MTDEKARRIKDKGYVRHSRVAVARIESHVERLDVLQDILVQDAVIRSFEIIGEAASKIQTADPAFAGRHPELRRDLAYRMRNALIHGCDAVNFVTVWNTLKNDSPVLQQRMTHIPEF